MRLNQRYREILPGNSQRNTWKSSTGAYIANPKCALRKVGCQEQRFTKVALDNFRRVFEAGQVENLVPATEEIKMLFKFVNLKGRQFNN